MTFASVKYVVNDDVRASQKRVLLFAPARTICAVTSAIGGGGLGAAGG